MRMKLRLLVPALLAAGVLAGCGANDAIDRTQDRVDRTQDGVDRAQDVIGDPLGEARREADRQLEDVVSPEDQP
jgi:hypothetical protein